MNWYIWNLKLDTHASLFFPNKFVGTWSGRNPKYPIHVAEAQGAMIGNTMFLVSGFSVNYQTTTTRCYAMDTTASRIVWQRMDDLPGTVGTTHAPSVVIGTKFYMCGGYVGGHPGPQSDKCFVYDNSVAPGNAKQWSSFLSLPDGRGGGGMVYDTKRNSLIFASGAKRPQAGNAFAVDYNNTWMYSFADPSAGWVPKASIPFVANHMSSVTAIDGTGNEHHFFMGGQNSEIECCGNHKEIYEFDAENETWIRRADMPVTRGHAASSTRPISCGFLIAAGTTNEYGKTADVSYYNIPTDAWTSIGNLTNALNTPVCDLKGGYLYCESGWVNVGFSYRRQITV